MRIGNTVMYFWALDLVSLKACVGMRLNALSNFDRSNCQNLKVRLYLSKTHNIKNIF